MSEQDSEEWWRQHPPRVISREAIEVALRNLTEDALANVRAYCNDSVPLTNATIRALSRQRLLNDDQTIKAGVCEAL